MNKKFEIKNIKFSEVLKDMENIFLKAEILKKKMKYEKNMYIFN